WRGGRGAPPDLPPRRRRRLVAGGLPARPRGALPGGPERPAGAPAGAAGPVRRLRRLAAAVAHGRGLGGPARLLARAAGRRPVPPRAARRPPPPGGAEPGRRPPAVYSAG